MATPPDTAQLERLSRVTANYNGLQGLVLVPMGVLLLVSGLVTIWSPHNPVFLLGVVPTFIAMGLITRYYHRRFGRVRSGETGYQFVAAAAGLAVFFLLSVLLHILEVLGTTVWLGGVQVALTLATVSLVVPLLRRRLSDLTLSRHWQIMTGGLLCIALVPVGLFVEGGHPLNTVELSWPGVVIAFGLPLIVGGVLDHRLLVRSLGASRTTVEEG
ncbi:hypothetical protein [Nocardiopsis salina]|uniref:hypothetical protein n=1 Tax=Nocardiopsis salina TaxID=245836 RepID=UPI000344D832|nr:hypothetical protein [Nocardiopsis salina]